MAKPPIDIEEHRRQMQKAREDLGLPPKSPVEPTPAADEPATDSTVIPEPEAEKTVGWFVKMLAERTNPMPTAQAQQMARDLGFSWEQVLYAAGMKQRYRRQGKYASEGPLLAIKRLRGGRRNETWIWSAYKMQSSRLTTKPRVFKCRDCHAMLSTAQTTFRGGRCTACYFKRRRATVGRRQQAATLGGDT